MTDLLTPAPAVEPLRLWVPWPTGCFPNERHPLWRLTGFRATSRSNAKVMAGSEIAKRYKARDPFILPPEGKIPLTFIAHPKPVKRKRDDDGIISAMKWARDGIAEALKIDDNRFETQPVQWGEPSAWGTVEVIVG